MEDARRPRLWQLLPLVAGLAAAASAARAGTESTAVQGLIVRLKSAPAHEETIGRSAGARPLDQALADRESARWRSVLVGAGLSGLSGRREPGLRPVGRDQQLLRFDRVLDAGEVDRLRERLMRRSEVEWVEPNGRERRLQVPPTDPYFGQQWWLQPVGGSNSNTIDARSRGVAGFQSAWARFGPPTAPVVVAVLDTGLTAHPDLDPARVVKGHDFVSEVEFGGDGDGRDDDPTDPGDYVSATDLANPAFAGCQAADSSWHGTIVAGMIAAQTNNGTGGAGVQWAARILPVRVAGKCGAEVSDIVDGMRWAAGLSVPGAPANAHPARVVNISFGGSAACGSAYQTAIDELRAHDVVVVAAAGNEWGAPTRPASCSGVVGVVGLNRDGFKTTYSNFGRALSASGIATVSGDDGDGAWGTQLADTGLVTLTNTGRTVPGTPGYARLYGTSFAVPQVSGTIALMLGLNPALSHDQIVHGLQVSARPHAVSPKIGLCSDSNPGRCICTTETCGAGMLDAEQAMVYAVDPSAYVPPVRAAAVIDNADVDAALRIAPQDRVARTASAADASADGSTGGGAGGSSGGGAFGGAALLGLASAVVALRRARR